MTMRSPLVAFIRRIRSAADGNSALASSLNSSRAVGSTGLVLGSVEALPVKYGWLRELLPEQVNGVLTVYREVAPRKPFDHIPVNSQRFVSEAKTWEAMNTCGLTTPALAATEVGSHAVPHGSHGVTEVIVPESGGHGSH